MPPSARRLYVGLVFCVTCRSYLSVIRERARAPRGPLRVQGDSCTGRSCGVVVSVSVSVSAINSCDASQAGRRVVQSERARSVVSSVWLSSAAGRAPQVACVAASPAGAPCYFLGWEGGWAPSTSTPSVSGARLVQVKRGQRARVRRSGRSVIQHGRRSGRE
jgi:hypothetical protein